MLVRLASSLLFASVLFSQTESWWAALNKRLRAANQVKDYAEQRAVLLEFHSVLSGHSDVAYGLAGVEARLGNRAAALDWLRKYAAMGLTKDIAADADFASLSGSDEFRAIAATLAENAKPHGDGGQHILTLPDAEMISEDIVYDPAGRMFYVSSVHRGKIISIDRKNRIREFASTPNGNPWAVLGLAVDPRRRLLYASTAAMPQASSYRVEDKGRSAVLKYDLRSGTLLKRYDAAEDTGPHSIGDLAITLAGRVFLSDSYSGEIFTIDPERDQLEVFLARGTLRGPQTPALTPDGRWMFVPDYGRGIAVVELRNKAVTWLAHDDTIALNGIDGLYFAGHTLLAVQNGPANRLLRIDLDDSLTRVTGWRAIESGTPQLGSPTHAVIVGGHFYYLGNTGWDRIDNAGKFKPGPASPPQILRIALPK